MTGSADRRIVKPQRILVAALMVLLLVVALIVVLLAAQPSKISLRIDAPVGERVFVDLVVDGKAETCFEIVPVTYDIQADSLAFAVVTHDPEAGAISATVESNLRRVTTTSRGVTGRCKAGFLQGSLDVHGMSSTHVNTMRSAALRRESESTRPR